MVTQWWYKGIKSGLDLRGAITLRSTHSGPLDCLTFISVHFGALRNVAPSCSPYNFPMHYRYATYVTVRVHVRVCTWHSCRSSETFTSHERKDNDSLNPTSRFSFLPPPKRFCFTRRLSVCLFVFLFVCLLLTSRKNYESENFVKISPKI